MKIKVDSMDYTYDKIMMITSQRGGSYSIRFRELGEHQNTYPLEFWGHLNEKQAKRMVNDLKNYLKSRKEN
jgi:hypothetical protein